MTAQQKYQAFLAVRSQVEQMERRFKHEHIQAEARAIVSAQYAEMVKQRELAQRSGGFSFLR